MTVEEHKRDLRDMLCQRWDQNNEKAGSSEGDTDPVTLATGNYSFKSEFDLEKIDSILII